MGRTTAGVLLGRVLRAAGVDAVYGWSMGGVDVVEVDGVRAATLLAAAHRRVHGRQAAVHEGDGDLVVGPGRAATPVALTSPADLPGVVDLIAGGDVWLQVAFDLAAPAPDVIPARPRRLTAGPNPTRPLRRRLRAAERPIVLAGPGVVLDRAGAGLHAIAAAGSLGVLNTWGAKGVFDWRSRHHLATAGLQADDFALGGLADADLIVATGVDADEAPADRWRLAPVVESPPSALDPLAERWARPLADVPMPAAAHRGWRRSPRRAGPATGGPLAAHPRHPPLRRGARRRRARRGRPGRRRLLGGPHVRHHRARRGAGPRRRRQCGHRRRPARSSPGCGRPGRPVLAVGRRAGGADRRRHAGGARRRGPPGRGGPLAVWDPSGEALDADDHLAGLRPPSWPPGPAPLVLATDRSQWAAWSTWRATSSPGAAWPERSRRGRRSPAGRNPP